MNSKDELLSIGEMAKLSGAGIQALRYYERKNILKPAYTDPGSGYRYYSLDQLYYVILIVNCVGLDIPLRELADVFNTDDMIHMKVFLKRCNKVAERKIKMLQVGIDAFNKALQKMKLGKLHQSGQIYARGFSEKTYYIKPYEHPLKGVNLIKRVSEAVYDLYGEDFARITEDDNPEDLLAMPDIGGLCQYSPKGINYFACTEVSKQMAQQMKVKDTITVPAGTYYFRPDESSRIEDAREIFKEQLKDKDTFMIIETQEPFFSKSKISQPMYELMLIV